MKTRWLLLAALALAGCTETSAEPASDASAPKDSTTVETSADTSVADGSPVDANVDATTDDAADAGGDARDATDGEASVDLDASDAADVCECNSGRFGCPSVICQGKTCDDGYECCAASPYPDGAANGQCAPAFECHGFCAH